MGACYFVLFLIGLVGMYAVLTSICFVILVASNATKKGFIAELAMLLISVVLFASDFGLWCLATSWHYPHTRVTVMFVVSGAITAFISLAIVVVTDKTRLRKKTNKVAV